MPPQVSDNIAKLGKTKSKPNEMDAIYSLDSKGKKIVNDVPILIESDSDDDEPSVTQVSAALKKNNVNLIPVQKGRYTGGVVKSFAKPLQFGDRGFKSQQSMKNSKAQIRPQGVQSSQIAMNMAMARARAKIVAPKVTKPSYSIEELRNLNKIIRVLVIQNGLHWRCFFCKEQGIFSKKVDCENHIRDDHLADENSRETEYIKTNFGFVTKARPVQAAAAPAPMKINSARNTALKQLQNLRRPFPPVATKPKFECQHCGWEVDEKTVKMKPNNMFDCDSCGFESAKKMKNVAPVNALNAYYAKQKENAAINQRVKNNIRMAQFQNAKKMKLTEMKLSRDLKSNGVRNIPPKFIRQASRFAGRLDHQMDNSPGGLLASLYQNGWPQQQTQDNPLLPSDETPSEETDAPDSPAQEKEPEKEDPTKPPKVWGSAETGGFPAGWQWKVASVWSRRIKFKSPEGKVFNARIGAVNHMREEGTYTEEQIQTANNFDQEAAKSEEEEQNAEPVKSEQMDTNELLRNDGGEGGGIKEELDNLKDCDVVGNLVDNIKDVSDLYDFDDDKEEDSMLDTFSNFLESS